MFEASTTYPGHSGYTERRACSRQVALLCSPSRRLALVPSERVRVCLVYDCLYPHTIGGVERWYRELASTLVAAGHQVTYLTRRQWDGPVPEIEGVRVVEVMGRADLYDEEGRRRILPPVLFGFGVYAHLVRHRRSYDAVHTCSFPYFSLLGARLALLGTATRMGVDWFEVWSDDYWRSYLGPAGGRVGSVIQRLCVRLTPSAFVYSELFDQRLRSLGQSPAPVLLRGLHPGPVVVGVEPSDRADPPFVLMVGRLIPEKRAHLLPAVVAAARPLVPGLRGLVIGEGPDRAALDAAVAGAGMEPWVKSLGFVDRGVLDDALARAACLLVTSKREGYGIVVLEAAAYGTPVVVVEAEDNAAADLVEHGVNGLRIGSDDPAVIAAAVARVVEDGGAMRASTAQWFATNAEALAARTSAATVVALMAGP